MENEKKMIICASCGAEYDVSLVRCPFCGTAYAPAEEDEYMEQLEDIRKDLESHKEDAGKSLKKSLGTVIRNVILVVAVIMLLLFAILWISYKAERSDSDQKKEEFLINQGIKVQQEDPEK